jgi:hypothetical protein
LRQGIAARGAHALTIDQGMIEKEIAQHLLGRSI